ncbi:hypothetical protein [Pelagibius sp. Alg239-R121]|uniref:hypothetical protein n=1 Tax=Pelagibius sp. Alg239-R121 TaxID=2993448 RepID=UPI0024A6F38C|nr:hypothetical protein [Pelagibius sp. Alg239-R121]
MKNQNRVPIDRNELEVTGSGAAIESLLKNSWRRNNCVQREPEAKPGVAEGGVRVGRAIPVSNRHLGERMA